MEGADDAITEEELQGVSTPNRAVNSRQDYPCASNPPAKASLKPKNACKLVTLDMSHAYQDICQGHP